ncbi:MAG: dihydrodipicolinate synthase family protein [Acidimicrobiales bacterium]|nr:dihydrodipicolinate synthase family protein [Acidimicrobiales bacterium]
MIPEQVPHRRIQGMSAILLPHAADGTIDWTAFEAHVARTHAAGLVPAVNMDTGYVQLLAGNERQRVLDITAEVTGGTFVAGAQVGDDPGADHDHEAVTAAARQISTAGGTPVIFPNHGLAALDEDAWVAAHAGLGQEAGAFIAFELGTMFVPYGRIVSLDAYEGLLGIPECIGAKHSSLDRQAEWDRLARRDRVRPDFSVLTGNDLAIDMVVYGSDYLLGLSTMAPDLFGARDRCWASGDARFWACNDLLQYLGMFTFRPPVPAYRHDAAIVLELRGWASSDATPEGAPRRPASDRAVLADIVERIDRLVDEAGT